MRGIGDNSKERPHPPRIELTWRQVVILGVGAIAVAAPIIFVKEYFEIGGLGLLLYSGVVCLLGKLVQPYLRKYTIKK